MVGASQVRFGATVEDGGRMPVIAVNFGTDECCQTYDKHGTYRLYLHVPGS